MAVKQRIPRSRYPKNAEIEYYRGLKQAIRAWFAELKQAILTADDPALRRDGVFDVIFDNARQKWSAQVERLLGTFNRVSGLLISVVNVNLEKQLEAGGWSPPAISLQNIMSQNSIEDAVRLATRENVLLIKDIGDKAARNLEREIIKAVSEGSSTKTLAQIIQAEMQTTETRAALIARDQIGKLTGTVTRIRHQKAGINEYIWRTVNDERVRKAHKDRNGKKFSYDKPPPDGNPGIAINCRCFADPIIEEFENAN